MSKYDYLDVADTIRELINDVEEIQKDIANLYKAQQEILDRIDALENKPE